MFWMYNIPVCVCGQSGFFILYIGFFQVPENLQRLLKKKKREQLGKNIFFLQFFKL